MTWTCNGHPDQTWQIGETPGTGWTEMQNSQDPSMCLGVLNRATNDGANLVIWNCNGSPDQTWRFVPLSSDLANGLSGCYNIQNELGHCS